MVQTEAQVHHFHTRGSSPPSVSALRLVGAVDDHCIDHSCPREKVLEFCSVVADDGDEGEAEDFSCDIYSTRSLESGPCNSSNELR